MVAPTVTREEVVSAIMIVKHIAEAIREAQEIPSGILYASLNSMGCSIQNYERIIGTLTRAGLITKKNDLLVWTGPDIEPQA